MSAGVCGGGCQSLLRASMPPRVPPPDALGPGEAAAGRTALLSWEGDQEVQGTENNTETNNGQHLVSTYYVSGLG